MMYLAILLLSATHLMAQTNHILIMGGGGEPEGPKTIFDEEIGLIGDYLKKSKSWKSDISFNGGHSQTEKMLSEKFGLAHKPFTRESFESLIRDYEEKLLSGQIKKGDQLLIQLSSHGSLKSEGEKSHRLATNEGRALNLSTLEGAGSVGLDRLENLIQLAAEKEVKLAILDFSCHSGSTLSLTHPKTCIISSTGPKHFAWNGSGGFSYQFASHMKPGKNLEEVFLEALMEKKAPDFPMISTSAGINLQQDMYEGLTPFLYEWREDPRYDKFSSYLEKEVLTNQCEETQEIRLLVKYIQDLNQKLGANDLGLQKFRTAIYEYYEFQTKMREDLTSLNLPLLKEEHRFCSEVEEASGRVECETWTTEKLLSLETEYSRLMLEEEALAGNPISQAKLKNLKKIEKKKILLHDQLENIDKLQSYYKNYPDLEYKTRVLAWGVARQAALIYKRLYEKRMKEDKKSNPCRDFIL